MPDKPITVAETPLFVRQAEAVWDDAEREAFFQFIASHPTAGDVIPETGGVRKLRWTRAGSGKRGGVRVIYFYHDAGRPLYLLMVYAKARRRICRRTRSGRCARWPPYSSVEMQGKDKAVARFADDLIASMKQAAAHARGRKVRGLRVTVVETPNVRAIRRALRMSQHRFAAAFRIPLPTLKNWEQGRRQPDAPAAAYLLAIKRRPKEIMEAVAG
jgi:putative transcriptional regulator